MGKEECSSSVVVVVDNRDTTTITVTTKTTTKTKIKTTSACSQRRTPPSSAVCPQAPAGDDSDSNTYDEQTAAAAAVAQPSGKAEDSKEGEDAQSKHKAYPLPCRICLCVDLDGCTPASLMPHAAIQSLQEEGLDLRHFMACGPHCAKPAGECATSPTQLRCGCRGAMAVAHYVCALGWLAKRKTHKCEICGQIVANIRATDILLFAGEAIHLNVNDNNTAAGAKNNNAQANPPSTACCIKNCGVLALFCVFFVECGMFAQAGQLFGCWLSLHKPKKAIIVAASLLGLHIISLPWIILIAAKAQCLRREGIRLALMWCLTPPCLVLLLSSIAA